MSPAVSKKQRQAMAIAEHGGGKPGEPSAEMAKSMSKKQLHEFASTPEKGLPEHKAPKKPPGSKEKEQDVVGGKKMPWGWEAPKAKHGKNDVTVLKSEKVKHVK